MRIKAIHLVNVPPYADVMINLLKMVLKPKLISRVSVTVLNLGGIALGPRVYSGSNSNE
jgi:hypothetical protein